jgi:D-glycero-D-manno-heptose 1,7-bisphosphate phosphatase
MGPRVLRRPFMAMKNSAVFLDKDGTLIRNVPNNVDPSKIKLSPGAWGLKALSDAGYRLVVVSNQPGIALGYFSEGNLEEVGGKITGLLAALGVRLEGFYFCPHHPSGIIAAFSGRCLCRKPEPGLLLKAALDLGLDLASSWMIGDILDDVEAGRRAGCRTVLIDNGNETEWALSDWRMPQAVAVGLADAAAKILGHPLTRRRAAPGRKKRPEKIRVGTRGSWRGLLRWERA